ncbi:hypothetical protein I4U23_007975 [Adineta vaga]|nr:hypothetical protein I4U23_007975 [Adineta vaga]
MALVNIVGPKTDPFYCYKMPKLQIKIEHIGNDVRTVLMNVNTIGKTLRRSPVYITKFFCYELDVPISKETQQNYYAIQGVHTSEVLEDLMDKFIEKFLACVRCGIPEAKLVLCKRDDIELEKVCFACGYQGSENMKIHKLTSFIIKHLQFMTLCENNRKGQMYLLHSLETLMNDQEKIQNYQIQQMSETSIQWLNQPETSDDDDNQTISSMVC